MSAITTHILDTSRGRPAEGVSVVLERLAASHTPQVIAVGATDADGRIRDLLPPGEFMAPGRYHLTFDTGTYFRERGLETFYPEVSVAFEIRDAGQHYHVPLLLSPYGYSTYRGS
jgi:5-hydroxyisourate hydrolase